MKRLRVIGLSEQRSDLLQQLLHLGCVEISEPDEKMANPEWTALLRRGASELSQRKAELSALTGALDALDKYAPIKKGLFQKRSNISEQDFFDAQAKAAALVCADEINACVREIAGIYSAENKLNTQLAALKPWASLALPLERQSTDETELVLGAFPVAAEDAPIQAELAQAAPLSILTEVSADKDQRYCLLVVHRSEQAEALAALRPHSFSVVRFKDLVGTARENLDRLQGEFAALEEARKGQEQRIAAQKEQRAALQRESDLVQQEINREAVAERFLTNGSIFFAEGWVPADRLDAINVLTRSFTCAWETSDPTGEDKVPTLLKNPKWMDCINMVTEMYSLPAYDGIDPNPLYFLWYVFFFGFMFADVAYGIIICAISVAVIKMFNPKKTMGKMFHLGVWLGGSTAICGLFVGGFFGNALDVFYENFVAGGTAAMPAWMSAFCNGIVVNPVNDPMTVLIIAIVIGIFHLVMGQCIHIYMGFRDGAGVDALLDVVPWWILLAGIGVAVMTGSLAVMILGAVLLVATQGRHAKGVFGKIWGGISSLYGITDWLSDILSYARLMALMLATSVIAQVFNTLGALPRNIIVFIIVFLIGHGFNIGVNLIGTYVHAARLQYLEYFGKFYKEGGIPFRPLQYDTKYVDIIHEEEK